MTADDLTGATFFPTGVWEVIRGGAGDVAIFRVDRLSAAEGTFTFAERQGD